MLARRSAAGSPLVLRLATLALVMSCADRGASGPVIPRDASASRSVPAAVFVVEPAVIVTPTYDGSGQSVHPDIVAFDEPWNGARYWLTMTPYPKSNQKLENPSILASDDGLAMRVPAGLKNPIVAPPKSARDYNSDPELLYEAQTDRLVLFERLVERRTNTLRVLTSRDGVTWIRQPNPFWERSHQMVSPTVAPRPDAPARMWYVDAGRKGCDAPSTTVMLRTGSDARGRIVDTRWMGPIPTDLRIPGYTIWHIKARWIAERSEYWMLVSAFPVGGAGCRVDDLFFARSEDGVHWTAFPTPILRHGDRDWTAAAVYRSTFLYDAASDELRMWISARGDDGAWQIGYARARYESLLERLEKGEELSSGLKRAIRTPALTRGEAP